MGQSVSIVLLYFQFKNGKLIGVTCKYVNGNMKADNADLQSESNLPLKTFESKPRTYNHFTFFGTQVFTLEPDDFKLTQPNYIAGLHALPSNCTIKTFQKTWTSLACILRARSEYAFLLNKSLQMIENLLTKTAVAEIDEAIGSEKKTSGKELTYIQPFNVHSSHL